MTFTDIPESSLRWYENMMRRYKNFSTSEMTRRAASVMLDTIKEEIREQENISKSNIRYLSSLNYIHCSLDELLTYSDGALRYRIFQLERQLETGQDGHYTEMVLIEEKYNIENALRRR